MNELTPVTEIIKIDVQTRYLTEHLIEEEPKFAFAYKVSITNQGDTDMQLINRYWLITDGNGKETEVKGPGVVGEQPVISPGISFQYTSGAVLDTPVGSMQGYYEMQDKFGKLFKAPIDIFRLAVPNLIN
ncbi:MAG: ApaG protein [Paraglaciecola sp.]|jgi:ApaG protein